MNTEQYFNAVSVDLLDSLIKIYKNYKSYETATMNKADPGPAIELLKPVIDKIVGNEYEYVTGNFYKHHYPYLPHTDFKEEWKNSINLVIPLWYTGQQANLVIFDQEYHKNSLTWCLSGPVRHFDVNTGVRGNPCDYDVNGLTGEDIDDELYQRYLKFYPKKCYFGLSGKAYPFQPGSIIKFNNKKIHCTSSFIGEKLGLSLRFKKIDSSDKLLYNNDLNKLAVV